jgi:hypothetical protein
MIVHGGDSTWVDVAGSHRLVYGDTWALSLDDTTWAPLEAGGPRRTEHSAVYDAVRDRMVVYGGRDENGELSSDVWALSLADGSWSQLIPAGRTPLPRAEHTAIYDPEADRMIVFGGATRDWRWPVGDTWVLDFGATAMPDIRLGYDRPEVECQVRRLRHEPDGRGAGLHQFAEGRDHHVCAQHAARRRRDRHGELGDTGP